MILTAPTRHTTGATNGAPETNQPAQAKREVRVGLGDERDDPHLHGRAISLWAGDGIGGNAIVVKASRVPTRHRGVRLHSSGPGAARGWPGPHPHRRSQGDAGVSP